MAGATHAAAGMLAPLAETQFSQDDLAPLLQAGWEAYPALVDLLAAFTDVETGFLAQGAWIVAADPSDARAWDHVLEHARSSVAGSSPSPSARCAAPSPPWPRAWPPASTPRTTIRWTRDGSPPPASPPCAPRPDPTAARSRSAPDPPPGSWPDASPPPARRARGAPHAGRRGVLTADGAVLAAGLGHRGIGGAATAVEVPLRPVHGDVLRLRVRPEQLLPGSRT